MSPQCSKRLHCNTTNVCIRHLGKLNLIWRFDFRLESIFSCLKKYYALQKRPENNRISSRANIKSKSLIHTVTTFSVVFAITPGIKHNLVFSETNLLSFVNILFGQQQVFSKKPFGENKRCFIEDFFFNL